MSICVFACACVSISSVASVIGERGRVGVRLEHESAFWSSAERYSDGSEVTFIAVPSISHPILARLVPEEPEDTEIWLVFESSDAVSW